MENRINTVSKSFFWGVFLLYFSLVVKLILFKKQIGNVTYSNYHSFGLTFSESFSIANLQPLRTILGLLRQGLTMFVIQNLLGNIILFIPFGVFLPLLSPRMDSSYKVLVATVIVSFSFELVQLVFVLGTFDVDDIILNAVGGVIGYQTYLFVFSKSRNMKRS